MDRFHHEFAALDMAARMACAEMNEIKETS